MLNGIGFPNVKFCLMSKFLGFPIVPHIFGKEGQFLTKFMENKCWIWIIISLVGAQNKINQSERTSCRLRPLISRKISRRKFAPRTIASCKLPPGPPARATVAGALGSEFPTTTKSAKCTRKLNSAKSDLATTIQNSMTSSM